MLVVKNRRCDKLSDQNLKWITKSVSPIFSQTSDSYLHSTALKFRIEIFNGINAKGNSVLHEFFTDTADINFLSTYAEVI